MIKEKFISAIIGTLFFAVFRPFGISYFSVTERFLIAFGLLVVAFASCMICEAIVTYLLRMPHNTERELKYMLKRGIVFQVCNIIVLTVLLLLYFDRFVNNDVVNNHISMRQFTGVLLASFGCCFFIGLYWRNVYWKRYYAKQLEEAQLLNGVLMERARMAPHITSALGNDGDVNESQTPAQSPVQRIVLEGTTKESLSLLPSDFLFAESEGNYVSVHYVENGEARQTMLRTSMKSIVALLCSGGEIMQCHRAYIVNLSHVTGVEGRSSGIGLKLRHSDAVVPVSKGYVAEVKERIKNPQ